jgi:hypothetical protein
MSRTENVVDFASYRKRRQARRLAELMWAMYAQRAGYEAFQVTRTEQPGDLRRI